MRRRRAVTTWSNWPQAYADVRVVQKRIQGGRFDANGGFNVALLPREILGDIRPSLKLQLGAVTAALLISAGNVANDRSVDADLRLFGNSGRRVAGLLAAGAPRGRRGPDGSPPSRIKMRFLHS